MLENVFFFKSFWGPSFQKFNFSNHLIFASSAWKSEYSISTWPHTLTALSLIIERCLCQDRPIAHIHSYSARLLVSLKGHLFPHCGTVIIQQQTFVLKCVCMCMFTNEKQKETMDIAWCKSAQCVPFFVNTCTKSPTYLNKCTAIFYCIRALDKTMEIPMGKLTCL